LELCREGYTNTRRRVSHGWNTETVGTENSAFFISLKAQIRGSGREINNNGFAYPRATTQSKLRIVPLCGKGQDIELVLGR